MRWKSGFDEVREFAREVGREVPLGLGTCRYDRKPLRHPFAHHHPPAAGSWIREAEFHSQRGRGRSMDNSSRRANLELPSRRCRRRLEQCFAALQSRHHRLPGSVSETSVRFEHRREILQGKQHTNIAQSGLQTPSSGTSMASCPFSASRNRDEVCA